MNSRPSGSPAGCKRPSRQLFCACLLLSLTATASGAQLLSRDYRELWQNEVFENYGTYGYRDYDFDQENRRFDLFGDLIIDGVDVIQINEIRSDQPGKLGSLESRSARYDRFFDKLIIANEGFGPWSTRLIIGDHITTHFTPMTLSLPQFNGIRWDGNSKKNRFTVLAAQLTDRVSIPGAASVNSTFEKQRIFGSSLIGGHWESQIGDLLKVGTTFVNAHRYDSEATSQANSLKGTVPEAMQGGLRRVFVFFTDDDPTDDSPGAGVYGLTMLANDLPVEPTRVGRIEDLLSKVPVTPDLTSSIRLRPNEVTYLRRNRAWLKAVVEASNQPFFINLLDDIAVPTPPASAARPLRADGTDVVFYEFTVPDSVDQLHFEGVVADDYSIDVVGAMQVPTLAAGEGDLFNDWLNVLRAAGRPSGGSNLHRVEFAYGFPTGLSLLGFDFESKFLGVQLRGEYARSLRFLRMPTAGGERLERSSSMFFLNARRALNARADVGVEWFDVPHDYTTEFSVFKDTEFGGTAFSHGNRLYDPVQLVEDNDDLDQWADRVEHNDPLSSYETSLAAAGNGVYPGLDPDGDGILDFNVDNAGGADAFQPFIGYRVEPLELVYGDDYNNNGVADERENDNLPDYLYQPDHKGGHGFLIVRPTASTQVRLGAYRVEQERRGTKNSTRYLEGKYARDWEDVGYVRLNHRLKWVEDDISNTVYSTGLRPGASFVRTLDLIPDLLSYRDSFSSLTYFEWGLWTIPDVQIRNIVSYEYIDLNGEIPPDPQLRRPGQATSIGVVNKIDYTWRHGRLTVMPQFKHIYQRQKLPERELPERQRRWVMPILRVDLQVGPQTVLKTGIQGASLPLLREFSTDSANPTQDFRRSTYTAFLQNSSNYQGYDLRILMGLFRTKRTFTGGGRPSLGYVEYFFRILIG